MTRLEKHQAVFALLVAASLAIGWRAFVETFALAMRNDEYTYVLLILPVSVALTYLEWRQLQSMATLNGRTGSALLAMAALIACIALGWPVSLPTDVQLSFRMLALVLWWCGAFVLCFGSRASRPVLFPLCFLLGLVPLPQAVVSTMVALLQHGSAWAAQLLFAAVRVPVARDGVVLTIPGLSLQVAQECSSIRSSSMLLVTAIVVAHLLLRSPWRKVAVIALAVPLSVAKNGLRIFTIAMLGTRLDPGYLTGKLHHQGGIVFFAFVLAAMIGVVFLLRRGDDLLLEPGLNEVKIQTAGD